MARRQKGQSHARDGRPVAKLTVLAALPDPLLGRRFPNRSKSDALAFLKALSWTASIATNYLLELFSGRRIPTAFRA